MMRTEDSFLSTKMTSSTLVFDERPTKIHRSSLSELSSSRTSMALGSEKAVAASAKLTPCFFLLDSALVSSQSKIKSHGTSMYYQCQYINFELQ